MMTLRNASLASLIFLMTACGAAAPSGSSGSAARTAEFSAGGDDQTGGAG